MIYNLAHPKDDGIGPSRCLGNCSPTGGWLTLYFELIGEISDIETIVLDKSIRDIKRLKKGPMESGVGGK